MACPAVDNTCLADSRLCDTKGLISSGVNFVCCNISNTKSKASSTLCFNTLNETTIIGLVAVKSSFTATTVLLISNVPISLRMRFCSSSTSYFSVGKSPSKRA